LKLKLHFYIHASTVKIGFIEKNEIVSASTLRQLIVLKDKGLQKNPLAISHALETGWNEDNKSTLLQELIEKLVTF